MSVIGLLTELFHSFVNNYGLDMGTAFKLAMTSKDMKVDVEQELTEIILESDEHPDVEYLLKRFPNLRCIDHAIEIDITKLELLGQKLRSCNIISDIEHIDAAVELIDWDFNDLSVYFQVGRLTLGLSDRNLSIRGAHDGFGERSFDATCAISVILGKMRLGEVKEIYADYLEACLPTDFRHKFTSLERIYCSESLKNASGVLSEIPTVTTLETSSNFSNYDSEILPSIRKLTISCRADILFPSKSVFPNLEEIEIYCHSSNLSICWEKMIDAQITKNVLVKLKDLGSDSEQGLLAALRRMTQIYETKSVKIEYTWRYATYVDNMLQTWKVTQRSYDTTYSDLEANRKLLFGYLELLYKKKEETHLAKILVESYIRQASGEILDS